MNQTNLSLLDRLMLPTSPFHKPLVYIGVLLATLASALLLFESNLTEVGLAVPAWLETASKIVGVVSATVAAVAQTTVDFDSKEAKKAIQVNSLAK